VTSTFSANKGLEEPAFGDYINAWATPVNANWTALDTALGGTTSISVTGISAPTITLILAQYRPPNIEFTGTLSANLNYQIPTGVGGMWSINNGTSGAFTLVFSIVAGNSIVLTAGRTLIISNGVTVALANPVELQLYPQTASESAASIAPTSFFYPPGNVLRYGAVGNGTTDDTTAITNALLVCNFGSNSPVVLPQGYTFKITNYIQIYSNTTIFLYGTVQLTARQSGFFANVASNIQILGNKIGLMTDLTVSTIVTASITGITNAAQAVITINTVSGSNPFSVGQQIGICGIVGGMLQIAGLSAIVQAIGGSSGAWTITVNINSSGFSTYTSGDVINSGYFWNPGSQWLSPSIHLRSVTNAVVDGVNFNYVSQGVLTSNATANNTFNTAFVLSQAAATAVIVRNCSMTNTEWSGCACFAGQYITYELNYLSRNGDGGMWMMGCSFSKVIDNYRISPTSSPTAYLTFGANNQLQPTTWNDEQGIQFEACADVLVRGNFVANFWAVGIDVKNGCRRVLVTQNMVVSCENASIIVRDGDSVKNACFKVSILGNTITSHGTLQYNLNDFLQGAIYVSSCYITEVIDNIIYSYQTTPGIVCLGPGAYQNIQYPSDPHQASLVVRGNCFDFKNSFQQGDTPAEVGYSAATLSAIQVNGQYDSVQIENNKITADYYLSSDARINATSAITLIYISANSTYYPTNAKIDGNTISSWGGAGISVTGLSAMTVSALSVCGNSLGVLGQGSAVGVTACNYCNVSGNTIAGINGGSGSGITVVGSIGNLLIAPIICNNSISGSWQTGGNSMAYGINLNYCSSVNGSNNKVVNTTTGNYNITNCTGDVVLTGSTGFPRSGVGSPNGVISCLWQGELYFDIGGHWYAASSGSGTTAWTALN